MTSSFTVASRAVAQTRQTLPSTYWFTRQRQGGGIIAVTRGFSTSSADAPRAFRPILTFLSPHPSVSRAAAGFLEGVMGMSSTEKNTETPIAGIQDRGDALDDIFFGSSSDGGTHWDSVASRCPTSGAVLHFLSPSSQRILNQQGELVPPHMLLSLSAYEPAALGGHLDGETLCKAAVVEARDRLANTIMCNQQNTVDDDEKGVDFNADIGLASKLKFRVKGLGIRFLLSIGRQLSPSFILGSAASSGRSQIHVDMPQIPPQSIPSGALTNISDEDQCDTGLREVVLPFYPENASLQSVLSNSGLSRPMPGLYQFPDPRDVNFGAVLRPIPAADEDMRLPPPSLVFRCSDIDVARAAVEQAGCGVAKVGWRGSQRGQLSVLHPSLSGLDVRLCEADGLSSSFDEAQEALLAASLDDLQSAHVISDGNKGHNRKEEKKSDAMNGLGDCWVEFRSSLKNPSRFLKGRLPSLGGRTRSSQGVRVAKPPDIPYE